MTFIYDMYTAIDLRHYDNTEEVERFLSENTKSSYFHSPYYLKALQAMPDTQAVALAVISKDNSIKALAIGELGHESKLVPWLSKRLLFYDAPLYEDIDALSVLLDKISTINVGLFAQIRPFHQPTPEELNVYQAHGFIRKDHLNAFISLKNRSLRETMAFVFKSDKRKSIRKALGHNNIEIVNYREVESGFEVFYEMLRKLYVKKRHGIKSPQYFRALLDHSGEAVDIVFASHKDTLIATQLFTIYNGRITAFYTATLEEHKDKQAGDLLIHHLIKTGMARECRVFDFGGGGDPNEASGIREYKNRFGTTFQNVGRFTLPNSRLYAIIMFVYKLFLKKQ